MNFRFAAAIALALVGSAAMAEDVGSSGGERTLSQALIHSTLLGCMPNVDGMLPLDNESPKALGAINVKPVSEPPSYLANFGFGPVEHRYARADINGADLWLVAAPSRGVCRIVILDTNAAVEAREALAAELQAEGAPWQKNEELSATKGPIETEVFFWRREGTHDLVVNISGPNAVLDEGRGLQGLVTIARVEG